MDLPRKEKKVSWVNWVHGGKEREWKGKDEEGKGVGKTYSTILSKQLKWEEQKKTHAKE